MRNCPKCGTRYSNELAYCPNDGTATMPVATAGSDVDPLLGTTIDGRYRIEARIGEGGMGVVYRASHTVLKKALAIKVMRGEQAHDVEVVQRFVQEAQASSAIGHPNIIGISDFGTTADGAVYFAMEYLEGCSLGKAMEHGPLPTERAIQIFQQLADALEAAHQRGIVHRDLKPDNVFLIRQGGREDFVKVLDFGIAKVRNAAAKITRTGMVFGTPHYMSPEQAAGQAVDHRSDIYSLGVIMYQVFVGQLPFDAESYMGVMTKHMYDEPVPPSRIVPQLAGSIEAVIMKALEKKPEQRYQSMLELEAELERLRRGEPVLAADRGLAVSDTLAFTAPPLGAPSSRVQPAAAGKPKPTLSETAADSRIELPRIRRPGWLLPALVSASLGLVVAYGLSRGGSGSSAGAAATAAPRSSTSSAAPVAPSSAAAGAVQAAPTSPPSAADDSMPRVHVSVRPVGSELYADGALIGQTDAVLSRPRAGQIRLEARHFGYVAKAVLLDPTGPDTLQLALEAEPRSARKPTATAAPASPEAPVGHAQRKGSRGKPNPLSDVVDPWQ